MRGAITLINTCRVVVGFSRGVASGAMTTVTREGTIVVVCVEAVLDGTSGKVVSVDS